jgi:plastocyanin
MKEYAILFIALICATLICGCISQPSGQKPTYAPAQITTHVPTGPGASVIIKARAFDPSTISIKAGTTVTWTNEDSILHHVVHLPEVTQAKLFDSGPLSRGESYSYTFTEKGTYNYGDPQIGGGQSQTPRIIVE